MNANIGLAAMLLVQPVFADQAPRADGSLIHYTIDYPEGPSSGLLVLSQGSGCVPGVESQGIATVRAAFPTHAALIVEKAGIEPGMPIDNGYGDCPQEFLDRYTISQRVEDYVSVLSTLGPVDGHLVLFGGSEGGLAMARLATRIHADAAVMLSSGVGTTFGEMVLTAAPPEARPHIEAAFAAARAAPESSTMFGGQTYRFWADSIDRSALQYLLTSNTPVLVIQGGLDRSGPRETSRVTADAFAAAGKCNLTYLEFPAFDHGMLDPGGTPHLSVVAALAAAWTENPMPAC